MLTRRSVVSTVYRHWLTVGFLLGFVTDFILLNRIDDLFDNLILLFHATVATVSLVLLYATATERLPGVINRSLATIVPLAMQYSFGGLLSGMLIFYGRSGDWLNSAPFLLLIIGVIFGNELIKKRSDRLLYHLSLYFIGIFSYIVLVTPVLLGAMGDWVFVLSSLMALLVVWAVVQALVFVAPHFLLLSMRKIVFTLGVLFTALQAFYFLNIIPPIPLSLTELMIVHAVERTAAGDYELLTEPQPWWRGLPFVSPQFHPAGGTVACFARVYAPTRLATDIYHRWEYKDENGVWREHFHLSYPISGESEGGYRGYTSIARFFDGTWRCSVETARGQVLGRRTFEIELGARSESPLVTELR